MDTWLADKALFSSEFLRLTNAPHLLALVVLTVHVLCVVLQVFHGPWASTIGHSLIDLIYMTTHRWPYGRAYIHMTTHGHNPCTVTPVFSCNKGAWHKLRQRISQNTLWWYCEASQSWSTLKPSLCEEHLWSVKDREMKQQQNSKRKQEQHF